MRNAAGNRSSWTIPSIVSDSVLISTSSSAASFPLAIASSTHTCARSSTRRIFSRIDSTVSPVASVTIEVAGISNMKILAFSAAVNSSGVLNWVALMASSRSVENILVGLLLELLVKPSGFLYQILK